MANQPFIIKREKIPIQVSVDSNIINVLNKELLNNKFLPAITQGKVIVYLTDIFLNELLSDNNITRRTRHADISRKLFNGNLILSLKKALEFELKGQRDLFYDQTTEAKVRQLIDNIAQGKQLTFLGENKLQELLKSKKNYDEYLKIKQEDNLKNRLNEIKKAIISRLLTIKQLRELDFEQYYGRCPKEQKLEKLQKFFKINRIVYGDNLSLSIDNPEYPHVNLWLRSWYLYHYYTVQKGWTTLRKNDATDLMYIVSAYCVDHFVTNDKVLINLGNICYNSTDKFITWDNFESKF